MTIDIPLLAALKGLLMPCGGKGEAGVGGKLWSPVANEGYSLMTSLFPLVRNARAGFSPPVALALAPFRGSLAWNLDFRIMREFSVVSVYVSIVMIIQGYCRWFQVRKFGDTKQIWTTFHPIKSRGKLNIERRAREKLVNARNSQMLNATVFIHQNKPNLASNSFIRLRIY